MSLRQRWLVAILALIAVIWAGYALLLRNHRLSFVPAAMGVSTTLYAGERSYFFGSGAGILVYEMPKPVAAALQAEGLKYLEQLPQQSVGGWRGLYSNWLPTPVTLDQQWEWPRSQAGLHGGWTSPGIGDYLFRYGDLMPLDRDVEQMVNDSILRPGSYYAYGRIGMIILIPATQRIVYAHPR
jgi:hypothetical protein